MADRPQAVAAAASAPHPTLIVGRRRHHAVDGWTPDQVAAWLEGSGPAPAELEEPAWLADGYRWTDDLRSADDASFRYVISAVMALPREAFTALGGFDESFVGYGGEDWEFAQRCWLAGLDLRHEPGAVAWHDGPEISGRPEDLVAVLQPVAPEVSAALEAVQPRGAVGLDAIDPEQLESLVERIGPDVFEKAWRGSEKVRQDTMRQEIVAAATGNVIEEVRDGYAVVTPVDPEHEGWGRIEVRAALPSPISSGTNWSTRQETFEVPMSSTAKTPRAIASSVLARRRSRRSARPPASGSRRRVVRSALSCPAPRLLS